MCPVTLSLAFGVASSAKTFRHRAPAVSLGCSLGSVPSNYVVCNLSISFAPSVLSVTGFSEWSRSLYLPVEGRQLLCYLE